MVKILKASKSHKVVRRSLVYYVESFVMDPNDAERAESWNRCSWLFIIIAYTAEN